jgi:hypothetical protein
MQSHDLGKSFKKDGGRGAGLKQSPALADQ